MCGRFERPIQMIERHARIVMNLCKECIRRAIAFEDRKCALETGEGFCVIAVSRFGDGRREGL